MFVGFLEFLGTTEFLVILFAALVLFGPRRLPQLSRSLGKSLSEFKRASEDFKRTWEREVDMDSVQRELTSAHTMLTEDHSLIASTEARSRIIQDAADRAAAEPRLDSSAPTLAADAAAASMDATIGERHASATDAPSAASEPSAAATTFARKRDWL